MAGQKKSPLSKVKTNKVFLPILIGLGYVGYMFYEEFDPKAFSQIPLSAHMAFWMIMALVMMATRDIGYIIRLKILTDGDLTWRKAFNVVMLWEFTSAITPSAIGGTSVAILYINKEGISIGRSSAVVMATSFLDELYFILMFPLLFLLVSSSELFAQGGAEGTDSIISDKLIYFAVIGYAFKLAYLLVLTIGLFRNPRGLKWLIMWVFKLPILKKWRYGAHTAGSEIVESSKELRKKPLSFWLKAFGATFFSWSSRYWVVNMLFLALAFDFDHILLFARQLVMWIMMLIMPTPGGSGFAEYIFGEYLGEFIHPAGLVVLVAFLWRVASYYPYLFIGIFMFPRWVKSKFGKKEVEEVEAA